MELMELKIEYLPIGKLKPYTKNARKHERASIDVIKHSIEKFGMNDAIGIWSDKNIIVEGHGRWLACKELGMKQVPVVRLDHLTDEERRAYALAHNKTAEVSEWDFALIDEELATISDIDMSELGFDIEDIRIEEHTEIEEDEAPSVDEVESRCKLGDIWQLGSHRLVCGDSTDKATVEMLMNGAKADMVFTDPPYNVNYTDVHDNERKIMNDNFASDEECGEKLWLPAFINMREVSNDCCSYYMTMPQGGTHMMMMMMMMKAGWQVKHELIWLKQSIVLNRADYNYQHEPISYGWNKTHKFYGKGKFKNTSVWQIDRPTKSKEHPTMKPIELICEALNNSSQKGDIVVDLFGGSGSTLIACEQLGRKCYTMELDEKYASVIVERWEKFTGKKAVKL